MTAGRGDGRGRSSEAVHWVNDPARYRGNDVHRWIRETYADALSGRRLVVIGKNPSMADERRSDPTFTSVQAWATRYGFSRVCFVNLFALRTPHPRQLEEIDGEQVDLTHAIGPGNDDVLRTETAGDAVVVAAWGGADKFRRKDRYRLRIHDVLDLLHDVDLHTVGGITASGYPSHGYCWNGLQKDVDLRRAPGHVLRPVLR